MDPINIDGTGGEEDDRRREEAARILRESGLGQALGNVRIQTAPGERPMPGPGDARRAEAQRALSGVDSALAGIRAPQMQGAAPPMQRDVVPPRPGGGLASQLGDPRRAGQPLAAPTAPDKRAQVAQVLQSSRLADPRRALAGEYTHGMATDADPTYPGRDMRSPSARLADPRGEEAEREAQLAALRAMYAKGPTR